MKNHTCVWQNIYNTARAMHSRYYKYFAKHACDFLLTLLEPCNFLYILPIMLKIFNKNYRNNRNISIFTSISYHSVFTQPPFLFFQHNQQCDTLLPIVPCTHKPHKLKAGIAYCATEISKI
jgi:hypothetical protein